METPLSSKLPKIKEEIAQLLEFDATDFRVNSVYTLGNFC